MLTLLTILACCQAADGLPPSVAALKAQARRSIDADGIDLSSVDEPVRPFVLKARMDERTHTATLPLVRKALPQAEAALERLRQRRRELIVRHGAMITSADAIAEEMRRMDREGFQVELDRAVAEVRMRVLNVQLDKARERDRLRSDLADRYRRTAAEAATIERTLATVRGELRQLQLSLGADHPEVAESRTRLAKLEGQAEERKRDADALNGMIDPTDGVPADALVGKLGDLEVELAVLDVRRMQFRERQEMLRGLLEPTDEYRLLTTETLPEARARREEYRAYLKDAVGNADPDPQEADAAAAAAEPVRDKP